MLPRTYARIRRSPLSAEPGKTLNCISREWSAREHAFPFLHPEQEQHFSLQAGGVRHSGLEKFNYLPSGLVEWPWVIRERPADAFSAVERWML